jgi:xanthine dehydrogenase iron-sulfur cluster and FAD-binding subunit A
VTFVEYLYEVVVVGLGWAGLMILAVVGKHVITVEGLGNAENPHPLQERMAKLHGSQYVLVIPTHF